MKKEINILMVDDHPFIIEAYKNVLIDYEPDIYDIKVTTGNNCQRGYEAIENNFRTPFDIAFLDINMPAYEDKKILSGENLTLYLKEKMPECKVILLTMHTEAIRISNIMKTINPEGLIIKNDLTFDELKYAFHKMLNEGRYYSQTVMKVLMTTVNNMISFDDYDRQILYYLSKGVKTKNIPEYVSLSLSAIEKRKLQIKDFFKIRNGGDEEIIREAQKTGFL